MKNDGYTAWSSQRVTKTQPTPISGYSLRNYRSDDEKSHSIAQPKINSENKQITS